MYRERVLSEFLIYLMRLMGGWHFCFSFHLLAIYSIPNNTSQQTSYAPHLLLSLTRSTHVGFLKLSVLFVYHSSVEKKKISAIAHNRKKFLINDTLLKSSSKCSPFHGSQFTPNRFLFYSLQFEILFITEIDHLSVLFIALPKLPKGQYINNGIIFFLPC